LAYVRVNNINNSSYTALAVDNNKVYSIKKIGTKVQWLIDNVVEYQDGVPERNSIILFALAGVNNTGSVPTPVLISSSVTVGGNTSVA
jgi:hypothetical protein